MTNKKYSRALQEVEYTIAILVILNFKLVVKKVFIDIIGYNQSHLGLT